MMKMRLVAIVLALSVAAAAAGCGGAKQGPMTGAAPVEVNVSAAVSLKDALTEIQADYRTKNPQVKLVFNLGASGSLQKQVEQGAPADVFISAAPKQLDELAAKKLIHEPTRKDLVENRLVLIVPQNSALGLANFEDLTKAGVQKLSMGEPAVVPAGQYAQQVLQKLSVWEQLKGKTVYAKDVRTVLAYVETGNVEAGIVYQTDAAASARVKIAAIAPAGSHQPIVYPAAVLAASKQPKAAEEFLNYLAGPDGMRVFVKYGFSPLGAKQ